jgi:hypothetical protein
MRYDMLLHLQTHHQLKLLVGRGELRRYTFLKLLDLFNIHLYFLVVLEYLPYLVSFKQAQYFVFLGFREFRLRLSMVIPDVFEPLNQIKGRLTST